MQPDLIIPDSAVPYIRWQRSRFIKLKVPDSEEVKRRYAEWVAEDYAGMAPHLPAKVDTILEIGCGMAAIEVYLKRRYPDAQLWLLDGTGENIENKGTPAEVGKGSWQKTLAPYNNRAVTNELLAANGVTVDRWIDIGCKDLLQADLILSMASFAYHYPRSTYRIKGFAILDFRRGKDKIPPGKVIFVGPKYDRVAFTANDE